MYMSRWSSVLSIAIALTACTNSLDPKTVPGAYTLNDINGRPLPTYEAPTPGLTRTIRSAGLSIDFGGTAELTLAVTQFDGTQATITMHYTYRLKDHDLIFASPCPPDANCLAPPKGRVLSTGDIELDIGSAEFPIVYHFRRITTGIMEGN